MPRKLPLPAFAVRWRSAFQLGGLAWQLIWRAGWRLLLGILLLTAVQALLRPVQLGLSRLLIDRAALDLRLLTRPDLLAAELPLVLWIILSAAALAGGQVLQAMTAGCQDIAGDRLTGYLTGQLLEAANRWQGLARFEDPEVADDLARVRSRVATGGLALMLFGSRLLSLAISAVGAGIVLLRLQSLTPLLLLLAALPQMAGQWEFHRRTTSHLYAEAADARRLQYSRAVLLAPESAKDVRLYGLGSFFHRRYDDLFHGIMQPLDRLRRRLVVRVALGSMLAAAASGGVYLVVVAAIAGGAATLGDLTLYGGAATLFTGALLAGASEAGGVMQQFSFLPSLFRLLHAPGDLPIAPHPLPPPRPIRQGIVFDQVSFAYAGRREPVLNGISFRLAPGESLALVGHNGAGKSTIVKLLLRLYDPTAGRILLDGVDLRDYDLEALRREFGIAFQDFVRYDLTAAENVGVGRIDRLEDRAGLMTAVRRAGADVLIESLPQNLDTRLGRQFDGRELSGGEWQKLALARAFLRDSQVLVLDEPTAALDVETEEHVYRRFRALTRGRMTLLISHRFATVRMADRTLYLADGAIREDGSHAELLAKNGEYARLFRLQAQQYADRDGQMRG